MRQYIFFLIIGIVSTACVQECGQKSAVDPSDIRKLIDYEPKMVAPGIISKATFEGHASITPDGREIYFAVYSNDHAYSTIAYSVKEGKQWTKPEIAKFSGKYKDGSPALSPDGMRLYFSSNRPVESCAANTSNDIWFVQRTSEDNWTEPVRMSDEINTPYNEFSPSVDKEGNLFFCSNRPGGYGDMDIYFARYTKGKHEKPVLLDSAVNSKYHEGNVGVSPDGQILFFMIQHKPGDFGYDDIHYSEKINGKWSAAKNVGPVVNTHTYDFSPKISPDGNTMYFASRISRDFYSPDSAHSYEAFEAYLNSPLNGLGNIYRIELSKLLDINDNDHDSSSQNDEL